jgi:hypothetical protein
MISSSHFSCLDFDPGGEIKITNFTRFDANISDFLNCNYNRNARRVEPYAASA